jgi:hypothetical protein
MINWIIYSGKWIIFNGNQIGSILGAAAFEKAIASGSKPGKYKNWSYYEEKK